MKAIHLKQFPSLIIQGAPTFLSVQKLWDHHPELRPQLSYALKRLSHAISDVVNPR